jgi:hypothetical protein
MPSDFILLAASTFASTFKVTGDKVTKGVFKMELVGDR